MKVQLPTRDTATPSAYPFQGGLDQSTPSLAVPPSRCVAALNYEPVVDGIARVTGYERTDGRLPSDAIYYILPFTGGSSQIHADDLVTGATSGATATVLLDPQAVTGAWGSSSAAGVLVVVEATGTFVAGEVLSSAGIPHAIAGGPANARGASTPELDDIWTEAAQDRARYSIQKPYGAGPIRGGFIYDGAVYCVRDDVFQTEGQMWKATSAGWELQTFGRLLRFKNGLVEVAEGDIVKGATSNATATVSRTIARTGGWGSRTSDADKAAGYLVLCNQTGIFQNDEVLKVGTVAVAKAVGADSEEIKLPPGGRYAFKVKNFYGATNLRRVYGVNGVGNGFEYNGGSVLVPIETGMPAGKDKPERIFEIANHLGFTYPGGSIQVSSPGEPLVFNAILGAAEIGIGDDITDVIDSSDAAVIFFSTNKVASLTGRDVETFVFEEITEEAGAEPWTVQRVGKTIYLDKRGVRDVAATAAWGNFRAGSISELFDKYLQQVRKSGARAVASLRCRGKGQYRLYFNDLSGFTLFMGRKAPEMLPFRMGFQVTSVWTGEDPDGTEAMYAGGEDGFVYRLDSGTSYDGAGVQAFAMMPFNHLGRVNMSKRAVSVTIEMNAAPRTKIGALAQFDYADGEEPHSGSHELTVAGGGGFWGISSYGDFYWSAAYQGMAEADLDGVGRNISLVFAAHSNVAEPPHTLQAYTLLWIPEGQTKRTAA